jgi:hypothetical protein
MYEWIEMFKSSRTNVADAGRYLINIHRRTNMERAQAMILGNYRVTVAETAARLGINVTCPWCKPPV